MLRRDSEPALRFCISSWPSLRWNISSFWDADSTAWCHVMICMQITSSATRNFGDTTRRRATKTGSSSRTSSDLSLKKSVERLFNEIKLSIKLHQKLIFIYPEVIIEFCSQWSVSFNFDLHQRLRWQFALDSWLPAGDSNSAQERF